MLDDPRHYQIGALLALLAYGWVGLEFDIRPLLAGAIIVTVLGVQFIGTRLWRLPH